MSEKVSLSNLKEEISSLSNSLPSWGEILKNLKEDIRPSVDLVKDSAKSFMESLNVRNTEQFLLFLISKESLLGSLRLALTIYGYYWFGKLTFKAVADLVRILVKVGFSYRNARKKIREVGGSVGKCKGQWVVVTGATSGIGLEFARILNLCGCNLLLIGRNVEKLDNLMEELTSDIMINKLVTLQIDFASEGVESIFCKLENTMKENSIEEIKLLINNVGSLEMKPFIDCQIKEHIKELNVNIRSHFSMMSYFENKIKKTSLTCPTGMLQISSLFALMPTPAYGTYAYSKSILNSFSAYLFSSHQYYYNSLGCNIGQVLTNMNNPLRKKYENYEEIIQNGDFRRLYGGFITAQDCARSLLVAFGELEKHPTKPKFTSGHPTHDNVREFFRLISFFLQLRLFSLVKKMRAQKQEALLKQATQKAIELAEEQRAIKEA